MKNAVVENEKFIRYKIANLTKFNPRRKERMKQGKVFYIQKVKEDPTKLKFTIFEYNFQTNGTIKKYHNYTLSYKNGRFNFYVIKPIDWRKKIGSVLNASNKIGFHLDLKKTHNIRGNRLLQKFVKNLGLDIKLNKESPICKNLSRLCYPVLQYMEDDFNYKIPPEISCHCRASSLKDLVKKCYGYDNRMLMRCFGEAVTSNKSVVPSLGLGLIFKKQIPLDVNYNILNNLSQTLRYRLPNFARTNYRDHEDTTIKQVKGFIKEFRERDRVLLARDKIFLKLDYNTIDTIRIKNDYQLEPINFNSIRDLHDKYSKMVRRMRTPELELAMNDNVQAINKTKVDDLEIVVPQTNHELSDWGEAMNNCIGGYSTRVINGRAIILGVAKDNKLLYNILIEKGGIQQFYGSCNQQPASDDKKKIVEFLINEEMISSIDQWNEENFWD